MLIIMRSTVPFVEQAAPESFHQSENLPSTDLIHTEPFRIIQNGEGDVSKTTIGGAEN